MHDHMFTLLPFFEQLNLVIVSGTLTTDCHAQNAHCHGLSQIEQKKVFYIQLKEV